MFNCLPSFVADNLTLSAKLEGKEETPSCSKYFQIGEQKEGATTADTLLRH